MATMTVELDVNDVALLRKIAAGVGGRSAKAHEVVPLKSPYKTGSARAEIGRFRRLVLIGAIDHRRNGYCYVTPAAEHVVSMPGRAHAID